jgi:hypothetical protein
VTKPDRHKRLAEAACRASYSSHFFDRLIATGSMTCQFLREMILLERRKAVRHRTFKGASIEFGGGAIDCTVRNLSEKGATLDVASSVGIPDKFNLHLKGEHIHKCRLIWRKEARIGVEFD